MKTATFLLSAFFSSWAAAAQDRFAFTATVQDVLLHVDAHNFEYPVSAGWSKRGIFEAGQTLTGSFFYNQELLTTVSANAASVTYSSLNPVYYYVDDGFSYINQYAPQPNSLINISTDGEYASVEIKSTGSFMSAREVSTITFAAATAAPISDLQTLQGLDGYLGTISYRWYAHDGRISTYSFFATIDSVSQVPELPIWALMLCGIGVVGAGGIRIRRTA